MAYVPEHETHKVNVSFKAFTNVNIEKLYNSEKVFTIETHGGSIYTNMDISWQQGWTRSSKFGNYYFTDGTHDVYPEDVALYCEDS